MSELSFHTMADHVGRELGVSRWIVVDQERIRAFADCTLDHQWIHLDEARAGEGPFGRTVAHGYLTLSLLTASHCELGALPPSVPTIINYGLDRVRFLAPVVEGSRIRNRATLLAVTAKSDTRLLVKIGNRVEIEGHDTPALVAETLALLVNED